MANKIVNIAIDGPSGSGKSSLADLIAAKYGFIHIDTGALYRTIGYYVCSKGVASDDAQGVIALLPQIHISMQLVGGKGIVFLADRQMGDEIRTPVISKYASDVSKIPEVRAFLLDLQRDIARQNNVVMDGRDIGTVILPQADVKVFLIASDIARATRRSLELAQKGQTLSVEDALKAMKNRDENDKNRTIAPAIPADDAFILDNSELDLQGTLAAIEPMIIKALQ